MTCAAVAVAGGARTRGGGSGYLMTGGAAALQKQIVTG